MVDDWYQHLRPRLPRNLLGTHNQAPNGHPWPCHPSLLRLANLVVHWLALWRTVRDRLAMPVVPFDKRSASPTGPQPTPQQLLMALATMKDLGRLNPNAPVPDVPTK